MCGAFSGRATSTAAVGVVHDSFISYSDGRRHRWSHNPFCVNRHDIFQNSTAEQRQFNETPSQRHVFCGKRHDPAVSASSRTRRQGCGQEEAACGRTRETTAPPVQSRGGQCANREHRPRPARERPKRSNGAPRNGKICAPCMIWGARAAKRAPSWQDLRAVYSQTAVCGAFRMHGAHILPKPAHFGCMAAICCRELAFFPSEVPSGTHEAKKLPRIAARERTKAKSCHHRTLGNAFRVHFAIGERPGGGASRRDLATAAPLKNTPRRHLAEKALGCPGLLRNRSGAT